MCVKGGGKIAALQKLRKIERALVVQQRQITEDVSFDFSWFGFGVNLLQLADDLLNRVLAVATLHNFETRAVEAQGAFRHQEHALLIVFAQTHAWSEPRVRLKIRMHASIIQVFAPSAKRRRGVLS